MVSEAEWEQIALEELETFQRSELLGEDPIQVGTRDELRTKLSERQTGGIHVTTLQKFGLTTAEREAGRDHPRLSDRSNVVVIVDEAHRSHYEDKRGYARHIRDEERVFHPSLANGGMSSGHVHVATWRERLAPLLLARAEALHDYSWANLVRRGLLRPHGATWSAVWTTTAGRPQGVQ